MPDRVLPGPVESDAQIREAVCVHTDKIFDSCKSKECLEDLRVYLTQESQTAVDTATSIRSRFSELVYVASEVAPVQFNRGFFTVDLHFYYRIRGEVGGNANSAQIAGLAVYDKRVLLYGSEGNAKIFRSSESIDALDASAVPTYNLPTAVVEALEPIILDVKMVEPGASAGGEVEVVEVPEAIANLFDSPLVFDSDSRRVYVTLGQFSLVRLERDAQLLIPAYDYCIPDKDCVGADSDDPCTLFSRIDFPVDEFFPPDSLSSFPDTYRDVLKETVQ